MKKLLLLCSMLALSAPANALSLCGDTEAMTRALATVNQFPLAMWMEDDHTSRWLYGTLGGERWTLVAVDSTGYACTMRDGETLRIATTVPVGEGA